MGEERTIIEQFMMHVKEDLTEIKSQVKSTNGRLRAIESWRAYAMGAMTIISLMVLPMFIWFLQNYLINK